MDSQETAASGGEDLLAQRQDSVQDYPSGGRRESELFGSTEDPDFEFDEGGLELAANEADLDLDEELQGSVFMSCNPNCHTKCDINCSGDNMTYLQQASCGGYRRNELAREGSEASAFQSGSITPDGLIDEDFEKELGTPSDGEEEDDVFQDVAQHNILEVAGDDVYGRKVIIFSSCKLPSNQKLDHQRLFLYLKHTLDQYVENDYVIVYFHYGLTSKNKPKLSWLLQVYRELDRKYKKNLKALYLVHPTRFIKILWNLFKPFISVKFGKKVMYVNYLHELKTHLHFDQLIVPDPVLMHDGKLVSSNKPPYPYSNDGTQTGRVCPTQQFGVTLQHIRSHYKCIIPPVVEISTEFLRKNALEVEGIFRRSANAVHLKQVQKQFNEGQIVQFETTGDVHIPAAILKTFLRELQEPLLTFDLYQPVVRLHNMEEDRQMVEVKRMFREELPEDNYVVLKFILQFLTEVVEHAEKNKMTSSNLSIVFGPNLLWPRGQASLSSMGYLNSFTKYLIDNYRELFES